LPSLLLSCGLVLSHAANGQAQDAPEPTDEFAEEFDAPAERAQPDETSAPAATGADALADPAGTPTTPTGYGEPNGASTSTFSNTTPEGFAQAPASPVYVPRPVPPRSVGPSAHPNMITVDPFATIQGLVVLSYHRAISQRVSFYVGPEYLIPDVLADNLSGGGLILGLGIHLIRPAPTGLWFGPRFEVLILEDGVDRGVGILAGAMTGYTWQWGRFTLSLGAGASYVHLEINGRTVLDDVIPTGRSALGVAF